MKKTYFEFVRESTKSLFRKREHMSTDQLQQQIDRLEKRLSELNKEGGLSSKRSQLESAIKVLKDELKSRKEKESPVSEGAAWTRKEGKNPEGGLNKKGVESYRRENPGSKLQTAVTTDPKKLKKGSKKAKRRLSFCRRMKGMKKKLTSAKTARDPNSRINKSLRKWNC